MASSRLVRYRGIKELGGEVSTAEEILLRFLEIGVVNVGADDTKLEKLRTSVQDLVAGLREAPSKAIRYTLVAADPDVDASDPTIEEAMVLLRKHWITVSNTFRATPVAIVRAMLLDAVVQCARGDDAIGVAFVNSARNALPNVPSGNERPVWLDVVTEIERKVDERAEAEWATPEMISISPLSYNSPKAKSAKVKPALADRDTLNAMIIRAAGPQGGGNQNPHWPNQPPQWAAEFAPRMTAAVADAIDKTVSQVGLEPIDFEGPFQSLALAVSSHLETALAAFSGATAGLQRRTNLLWWKEALYSPSAHLSYRDLPAFSAAALMALDLFEQVPTFSPASVSAFLREAVQLLPAVGEADERSFLDLLTDVQTSDALGPLREVASRLTEAPSGRGSLISLIGHPRVAGALDASALKRLGGIEATSTLLPPTWGSYLFREMQAARAISSVMPTSAKREI
jgi:hypothetical protein